METIVQKATAYVKHYMSHYDASHDYTHIQRVVHLAKTIEAAEKAKHPELLADSNIVTLAALLHDVGDKKYLKPGEDATTMVRKVLTGLGCPIDIATKVQLVCSNVSYSNESKHMDEVAQVCKDIPELRIVQDADRLDAIGAMGIGRQFVFTGAKENDRGMSVEHFYEKLLHIEARMKTETGKDMARLRTERMQTFLGWWDEEHKGMAIQYGA